MVKRTPTDNASPVLTPLQEQQNADAKSKLGQELALEFLRFLTRHWGTKDLSNLYYTITDEDCDNILRSEGIPIVLEAQLSIPKNFRQDFEQFEIPYDDSLACRWLRYARSFVTNPKAFGDLHCKTLHEGGEQIDARLRLALSVIRWFFAKQSEKEVSALEGNDNARTEKDEGGLRPPQKRSWPDLVMKVSPEIDLIQYSIGNAPAVNCNRALLKLSPGELDTLRALAVLKGDGHKGKTLIDGVRQRYTRLNKKLCAYFKEMSGPAIIEGKASFKISKMKAESDYEIARLIRDSKREARKEGTTGYGKNEWLDDDEQDERAYKR